MKAVDFKPGVRFTIGPETNRPVEVPPAYQYIHDEGLNLSYVTYSRSTEHYNVNVFPEGIELYSYLGKIRLTSSLIPFSHLNLIPDESTN